MKHVKLFEAFVNEGYSKSDLKKLKEFAEEVADEISWEYEDKFQSGDLDEDEFSHSEMYDYIVDWGETNDLTAKEVMAEFDWESLTFELGLR
jgi:arsenate reductase-like glutaredoxin family protein